jgi:uncharacterized protein YndB with AHSA1/START domain
MSTKLTVQSIINSNREKVWNYYTNPKHIVKWNFADPSWHCPNAENDLRVGGKYRARTEAIYKELVEGEKFTYEMQDGRQASANFLDLDGKTEVIVTFDAETINPVEMQKGGWQAILDNFKKYTEANQDIQRV